MDDSHGPLKQKQQERIRLVAHCREEHARLQKRNLELQQNTEDLRNRVEQFAARFNNRLWRWWWQRKQRELEQQLQELEEMQEKLNKLTEMMSALEIELSQIVVRVRPPRIRVVRIPIDAIVLLTALMLVVWIWLVWRR
jgi:predicted  nucleic acid-binding Zn-ribbon protein